MDASNEPVEKCRTTNWKFYDLGEAIIKSLISNDLWGYFGVV
jgi:hypothetical protein